MTERIEGDVADIFVQPGQLSGVSGSAG